ncbi:MAG: hypothetical protein JSS79_17760 [Bacteroidetes bacterium]|nr:hypothetical protein [Bacteroidota bacterium]
MKRVSLTFLFVLFTVFSMLACPYCGCGNSNFQIGVLPTFSNAFVGVRYSYAHFKTDSSSQFSRDYFHTTEIWGGYKVGKFQVMAFVPYLSIHKWSDDGDVNSSGLGDVTLLGNYQLLYKSNSASSRSQALWVGGGIKLPTGQSKVDTEDPGFTVGDFSSTPGTGSTDYLLNANHNWLSGKNGLVTNLTYRINTKNNADFQYGNRIYLSTAFFHSINAGPLVIRPTAGLNLVKNAVNKFQGQEVSGSDGYILNGMAGFNLQKGNMGILVNGFLPLSQDIYHGLTQSMGRASVALTYSF